MDGTDANITIPGQSVIKCPADLETGKDSVRITSGEVSDKITQTTTTNNPANCDEKNVKKSPKQRKPSRKRKMSEQKTTSKVEATKVSKKRNRGSVAASPNTAECPSNLQTDENVMEIQEDAELNESEATNDPTISDGKNTEKSAQDGEHSLKRGKPDIIIDEDTMGIQAVEVSSMKKATDNPESSDKKNTKGSAKIRKISVKEKLHQDKPPTLRRAVKSKKEMEIRNTDSEESGPNAIENIPSLNIDRDILPIQSGQVSNRIVKTRNPKISNKKTSDVPAERVKVTMERKMPTCPPTSQMVMEAFKALKKPNGVSVNAILDYIEAKYKVNAKLVKRYVTRFINSAVRKSIIDHFGGAGDGGRYKMKKPEKVIKDRKMAKKISK